MAPSTLSVLVCTVVIPSIPLILLVFPEWGHRMTQEEYVGREEMLDTKPHADHGKMTIWVLAPRSDPTTTDFFSSCETYHREAIVSGEPNSVAYGIASVFTAERHRGKGYAKHLMRLLHFVLIKPELLPPFPAAAWGEPPSVPEGLGKGVASVLYSDVGDGFYNKCGPGVGDEHLDKAWITHDPNGTIWPVTIDNTDSRPEGFRWISNEEQERVWKRDAELLRTELATEPSTSTTFSFLPDNGVAQFLYERNKNFVPSSWKGDRWGALIETPEAFSFATWALDPGPSGLSTLIITRLRATEESFPALLYAAVQIARELSLENVEVWNLPPHLAQIGEKLGGKTGPRDEHLPGLAWYGSKKVVWEHNEKFCWC